MATTPLRQLAIGLDLSAELMAAAFRSAQQQAKTYQRAHRPRRGLTLKPGVETPLWNALATAVEQQLSRYGEKARLGRVLGLPRQRIHDLLKSRSHLPDGERTLLLLAWLHARHNGQDLT